MAWLKHALPRKKQLPATTEQAIIPEVVDPNVDVVSLIIQLETGNLDDRQTIELFQKLLDTGQINGLQGSYQRMAKGLIEKGLIWEPGKPRVFMDTLLNTQFNVGPGGSSICRHCGSVIFDRSEEAGGRQDYMAPAWATVDGDYGCSDNPENDDEGTGGHLSLDGREG